MKVKTERTCEKGHKYFKSSDCPTCPVCEREKYNSSGFLSDLGSPARRALDQKGISTIEELANYTEKEILDLHGIGKSSIPKLLSALKKAGLNFKKDF